MVLLKTDGQNFFGFGIFLRELCENCMRNCFHAKLAEFAKKESIYFQKG